MGYFLDEERFRDGDRTSCGFAGILVDDFCAFVIQGKRELSVIGTHGVKESYFLR